MTEEPFRPVNTPQERPSDGKQAVSSDRAAYNVVTDTVTGVNARWSDNKFQAIFVFASMIVVAMLGALLAAFNTQWNLPWFGGALIGSFLGMVIGIFSSGTFLMVYRAARHIQGKHD